MIKNTNSHKATAISAEQKAAMTPREIVAFLDEYIIGQHDAKRAVAIALRNRYRRLHLPQEVQEEITSPTFNIIKEYTSGELPLYHMDVYRLDGKVDELGIEEYYTRGGITIIEWADMIPDYLPEKRLDIKIKNSSEDENKRTITLIPHGKKYEELCEAIL